MLPSLNLQMKTLWTHAHPKEQTRRQENPANQLALVPAAMTSARRESSWLLMGDVPPALGTHEGLKWTSGGRLDQESRRGGSNGCSALIGRGLRKRRSTPGRPIRNQNEAPVFVCVRARVCVRVHMAAREPQQGGLHFSASDHDCGDK